MIARSLRYFASFRPTITRLQRRGGYCYCSRWSTVATTAALLLLQQPPGRAMSTSTTTTTSKSRIAVAQLCSTSCKLDNLLNVATCAGWASHLGDCSMLFLPECFGFIGTSAEQTLAAAEPLPSSEENAKRNLDRVTQILIQRVQESALTGTSSDPLALASGNEPESKASQALSLSEDDDRNISLLDGLRTIAKASRMWISGGGMHVAVPDEPRVYNTHVIVDSDGMLLSQYRKMHLFDVCIPGKVDLRESKTTKAGEELVFCDSPIGCLGVTICYDLRFPEMYTELARRGAQIILIPSAFTVPTGQAHWHTLLRARAIENQCYVVAAAQYGKHNAKRESYGHSLVVDPWGVVTLDAGGVDKACMPAPSIATCGINLDLLASIRERMPVQEHRRQTKGI